MIWVEVLDRHGRVAQRVRCGALPATLGRAWTSDVVLDDRYVDPVHARLVRGEEGAIELEDAGSLNGIVTAAGERATRVRVAGPTTVRLGQATLRLVPVEAPVGPAVPLPPPTRGLRALLVTPRRAIAIALLGLVLSAVALRAADPDADSLRTVVGGVMGLTVVVAAWAGVWALVGRSAVQHARFLAHFAAAWLALLTLEVVGAAGSHAGFMLNAEGPATVLDAAAALVVSVLLVVHFAFATGMSPRRRVIVAVTIVVAVAGAAALLEQTAEGGMVGTEVTIGASVRPVPVALVRTDDLDAFLSGAAALRREVDDLAQERLR